MLSVLSGQHREWQWRSLSEFKQWVLCVRTNDWLLVMIIDFERAVHEQICFGRGVDISREIKNASWGLDSDR